MRKLYLLILILLLSISLAFSQTKIGGTAKVGGKINIGTAGTGGGGGDIVNDTFTQASDVNLSSHTGETGATWTLHPSYSGTITNDSTLDRIYLTSAAAASYYASGTPSSSTYCTSANFSRLTQFSNNAGITIGEDTSADTMILFRLNDNGATVSWEIIDRIAASNTALNSMSVNIPSLGGAAVTAKICRSGTALTVFFNGVQETGLNATTTITAIGKAGIRISGTSSSTTGIHIDNFLVQ